MKKKFSILLCLVLFAISGCRISGSTVRFGAADVGGMYYSFANTFTELANENLAANTFEVRTTAGSAANLRLLADNYIELGIAQADLIYDAYQKNSNLRAIAGLYTEACQLVVLADSDIYSLDDLSGRTVSIGAQESGTELNANEILEFAGMPSSIVTTKNLDYIEAAHELESGEIDAFFCTAGLTTTIIEELAKERDVRLISIDDSVIDKMLDYSDAYSRYTIPAGTYEGQDEDITTIGVTSVLVTSDSMSEDTIKQLTAMLFEKSKELQYATSLDLHLNEKFATRNIPIPFHSGAASYYEEKGFDVNN